MGETRKIVTIVFADVSGSTRLGEQLDAEALRRVMERYFEEMRSILEHHGGTLEKFIGDAVMAVFGIPVAHEDDALRGVRAAVEMRERLWGLNEELARERGVALAVRTGINTGEVVAGDPSGGEFYASGDAVNVAARLEQAAQPGEILLGDQTYRLVRDAVFVEPLEPLALKGKSDTLAAYRLLEVFEDAPALARRFDTPFVGREKELRHLATSFGCAVSKRTPVLVTLLGPAGIGKTRLADEFAARAEKQATVVRGRCLSYGEGITFWPLEEIVRSLAGRPAGVPDPEQAATIEEIFFAYRKLFEALARDRPLAVILEDIHWAEPTLLDFIEHVVEWTRDAPLLIVCLTRPELLDERPGWSGEQVVLDPLPHANMETLVAALAPDVDQRMQARATHIAEGNPFFLEQLLALAQEDAHEVAVPHTLQALLAARLDRLAPEERSLLSVAAVMGKEFWRSALVALSPPDIEVSVLLHRLVRKQLIRPEQSSFPDEDAFHFSHILIRDATYHATPKELRTRLHEQFADWLEARESRYDEIVGYHLEEAYRLRTELRPTDESARALATRAAERLSAAGRRAWGKGDTSAAINLLERAADLYPTDDVRRLEFSSELGNALFHAGRLTDAKTVLATAVQDATRLGHEKLSLVAAVHLADLGIHTGSDASLDDTLALARHAAEVFEAAGDDRALIHAWEVIHSVGFARGDVVGSLPFAERALAAAERIGDIGRQAAERGSIIALLFYGPSALDECIPSLEDTLTWARANGSRWLEALTLRFLGEAIFEQGRLREGRELRLRGELIREEIGQPVAKASGQGDFSIGEVAIDGAAVEARMRAGYDTLKALEEKGFLSTVAANLSQVLYWRGRYEEADHLALESESLGVEGDVTTQVGWRAARAMLHARRGDISQGEALARDAVERATATQYFSLIPESYLALGEVHRIAERDRKSAEALEQALRAYAEKGFILSADTVRARLAELPTQSRA